MKASCACSTTGQPLQGCADAAPEEAGEAPSLVEWRSIAKPLLAIVAAFLVFYFLPIESARLQEAVISSLALTRWYAREHVLLCLVPAFFIAGAIATFVSQAAVMKYLGAGARKVLAYGVSSVSGSILAVCSCTVLPLFAGIWKRGAGLGPAIAFLYSGPAINVLAIVMTARVLGLELGIARAVGAISFSVVIGFIMYLIYRKEETQKAQAALHLPEAPVTRPLWQNAVQFALLTAVLIFATWSRSEEASDVLWNAVYAVKWWLAGIAAVGLGAILVAWFRVKAAKLALAAAVVVALALLFPGSPLAAFSAAIVAFGWILASTRGETQSWFLSSWDFAKQITPLLLGGVLVAGLLLGQPGTEGIIPSAWVERLVGGNSLGANLFSAVVGAFMYFATLTEVPILQGLIAAGMGKGPALALLLSGPALSLPNMLVIRSVIGTQKTVVYCSLVVILSTACGMVFGAFF